MTISHHYWENAKLDGLLLQFMEPRGFASVDPGNAGALTLYPAEHLAKLTQQREAARERLGFYPEAWPRPQAVVSLVNGRGNDNAARECAARGISLVVIEQPFIPRAVGGGKKPGKGPKMIGSVQSAMRISVGAGALLGQIRQAIGETLDAVWVPGAAWQVILRSPGARRDELKQLSQAAAARVVKLDGIPAADREGLSDALGLGAWWIRRVWWKDL